MPPLVGAQRCVSPRFSCAPSLMCRAALSHIRHLARRRTRHTATAWPFWRLKPPLQAWQQTLLERARPRRSRLPYADRQLPPGGAPLPGYAAVERHGLPRVLPLYHLSPTHHMPSSLPLLPSFFSTFTCAFCLPLSGRLYCTRLRYSVPLSKLLLYASLVHATSAARSAVLPGQQWALP